MSKNDLCPLKRKSFSSLLFKENIQKIEKFCLYLTHIFLIYLFKEDMMINVVLERKKNNNNIEKNNIENCRRNLKL